MLSALPSHPFIPRPPEGLWLGKAGCLRYGQELVFSETTETKDGHGIGINPGAKCTDTLMLQNSSQG